MGRISKEYLIMKSRILFIVLPYYEEYGGSLKKFPTMPYGILSIAKFIDKYEGYDAAVQEIHHKFKLDKPSGTALRIGELLLAEIRRKEKLSGKDEGKITPGHIDISSSRVGSILGNHKVIFDSASDTITLEHNVKSRRGFAEGALAAAKFIYNKKGFYKFEEIFTNLI